MVLSPDHAVYPTQQGPLRTTIERLLAAAPKTKAEGRVHAVIVPDSNLISGGSAAAAVFKAIRDEPFDNVIIISPSHSGEFARINLCSLDRYRTPLGEVVINDAIREELCDEDDDIYLSDEGHFHTSGVDVQLPFIQTLYPDVTVVPVVMGDESTAFCRELGSAVGEVMYNRSTLVVACADIVSGTEEAVEELRNVIEAGDVELVIRTLNREEVRVLGKGAIVVAMMAAGHRRSNKVEVLEMRAGRNGGPGVIGAVLTRV